MRDVKFRAYIYDLTDEDSHPLEIDVRAGKLWDVASINFKDQIVEIMDDDGNVWEYELNSNEIVLLQYAGEKDKNGKEIYDGYILKLDRDELLKNLEPEDVSDDTLIQVVAFEDGAFTARSRSGIKWGSIGGMFEYGEIIGNIYENPGLLETI